MRNIWFYISMIYRILWYTSSIIDNSLSLFKIDQQFCTSLWKLCSMVIGSISKAFYSYWVVITNENKNVIFLLIRIKFWNQIIGFAAYIWLTNLVDMFIIVFFIFYILFWDKRIRLNSFQRIAMTAYFDQLSCWKTF